MSEKKSDSSDTKQEQPCILTESVCICGPKSERERTLLRKEIKKYIRTCEAAGMARPAEPDDAPAVSQKSGSSHNKSGSHSLASLHHFKSFR